MNKRYIYLFFIFVFFVMIIRNDLLIEKLLLIEFEIKHGIDIERNFCSTSYTSCYGG